MVSRLFDRRAVLAGLGAVTLLPGQARARDYVDLGWSDLLPKDTPFVPNAIRGMIDHSGPALSSQQPPSTGVRSDWNGQNVRMPGFIVPIDHKGTGVVAFILVPYVGACVHVPPPPANQLVFVTTGTPYESDGLFEPVTVEGMFSTSTITTHLAKVGYALSADRITPFTT
ncbi:MAG: DUF3299 domain-containing protein [Roseovarius sp.]